MEPPQDQFITCPDCDGRCGWPHKSVITGKTTIVECETCEGYGSVEHGIASRYR